MTPLSPATAAALAVCLLIINGTLMSLIYRLAMGRIKPTPMNIIGTVIFGLFVLVVVDLPGLLIVYGKILLP